MEISEFKRLARKAGLYDVVRYIGGEIVDSDGNIIPGVPSVTWAAFIAGTFDLTVARHVTISDRKTKPNGGYPLFFVDPAATTQKRILQSRTLYVATFADVLTNYPAASWPGLVIYLGELGIEIISNGTRYIPINGAALLAGESFGTIAAPTNTRTTTGEFPTSAPDIPADLLKAGDRLRLSLRFTKTNGGVPLTYYVRTVLGTTVGVANAMVHEATSSANTTGYQINAEVLITIGSATTLTTNRSFSMSGAGAAPAAYDGSVNFNIASPLMLGIWLGSISPGPAPDTAALLAYSLRWEA